MTSKFASIAITALLVTAAAALLPAQAADMSGGAPGSMKDRGAGGIPVPAPVPYEEHFKYYIGTGIGWTAFSSGKLGLNATAGIDGPSIPGYGDMSGPAVFSLTAGRYLTPSIRMELGLDVRTTQKPIRGATQTYSGRVTAQDTYAPVPGVTTIGTNVYDVTRTEDIKLANHTLMVNALYDLNRGGRFVPYVGAGVGIALRTVNRATSETATCVTGSNIDDPTVYGPGVVPPCRNLTVLGAGAHSYSHVDSATGWGLAASLMAGASYNLSERTHLDIGYRMLWQGGKVAVTGQSLNGVSVLNVGSRLDHEVRTGLRFDLW